MLMGILIQSAGVAVSAILLHEAGHATVAMMCGSPVKITISKTGVCVIHKKLNTRWKAAMCSLAGPATNVALAAICYASEWNTAYQVNSAMAVVNLMPLSRSDLSNAIRGWKA
jgi:Zn-dependent protease